MIYTQPPHVYKNKKSSHIRGTVLLLTYGYNFWFLLLWLFFFFFLILMEHYLQFDVLTRQHFVGDQTDRMVFNLLEPNVIKT